MTLCDRHTGRPAVLPRRRLVEQASLNAPATGSEVAADILDSALKSITTGLNGFISPVESFDTDASTSHRDPNTPVIALFDTAHRSQVSLTIAGQAHRHQLAER